MYGIPVGYMPYFWHADPSVKRASGLLIPSMGASVAYRRVLRAAVLLGDRRSVGRDVHADDHDPRRAAARRRIPAPVQQRHPAAQRLGRLSRQRRAGDDLRAAASSVWTTPGAGASTSPAPRRPTTCAISTSAAQLGSDPNLLTSQIYGEGFGQGAYSRFDVRFYQSLNDTIVGSKLPLVLPRYRVQLLRPARRPGRPPQPRRQRVQCDAHRRHQYPARQPHGELVAAVRRRARRSVEGHAAQRRDRLRRQRTSTSSRTSARMSQVNAARAQPQAALDFRWPFMRDSGAWGTQLIEPIAQIIVGAAGRRQSELKVSRTRTASTWSSPTPTCSASTASPASTGWRAACARMSRCTAPGISAAPPSTA